jgi:hypothetical protein
MQLECSSFSRWQQAAFARKASHDHEILREPAPSLQTKAWIGLPRSARALRLGKVGQKPQASDLFSSGSLLIDQISEEEGIKGQRSRGAVVARKPRLPIRVSKPELIASLKRTRLLFRTGFRASARESRFYRKNRITGRPRDSSVKSEVGGRQKSSGNRRERNEMSTFANHTIRQLSVYKLFVPGLKVFLKSHQPGKKLCCGRAHSRLTNKII